MTTGKSSRRDFLVKLSVGLALAPAMLMRPRLALASDAQLVSPDDPTAKSLGYVDDATKAKAAKVGSKCSNCSLYQSAGSDEGNCAIFPGKHVKAGAYCNSWVAKS